MRHWNLIVLFYLLFTLNQTPEAQKSTTLKQLETTWLNESQYFRARLEPEWPEKFLRKQNYSMLLMNPQRRQQTMKRYGPEWPEKIMKYNETKQSQNHKPQSPQTLQPFGLEVRKRATTKIALMDSKNQDVYPSQKANLHSDDTADENKTKVRSPITEVPQKFRALPDNRGSLYLRSDKKEMLFEPPPSQKKKPPLEPQGFFDDKPTTQDIIKASIAGKGLGIEGDSNNNERRIFDATDADFVSFLMVQADDMVESMVELFATRRVPHYFTVHHSRCYGVRTYCTEACLETVRDICRKYKCTRQVKEYVTDQCKKCNLNFVRKFPRQLLLSLDFLKAREVYSKITNRTFESFFPPRYLKPFYSKKQQSSNRTADISYYTDTSSEYYSSPEYYNTEEELALNITTTKIIPTKYRTKTPKKWKP